MLVAQVTVRMTSQPLEKILALLIPLSLHVASQDQPSTAFILRSAASHCCTHLWDPTQMLENSRCMNTEDFSEEHREGPLPHFCSPFVWLNQGI